MIGFKINEMMTGSHTFANGSFKGEEMPLKFSLTWGNKSLLKFLNPASKEFLESNASGFITVGGLADNASCAGLLKLMYFTKRKIRYELDFNGDDGRAYKYVGEKINIWPWNIHRTHFTCYGTITDVETGKIISSSVVYFPFKEIAGFILSARIVRQ